MTRARPLIASLLFLATIPLANWLIGNVGQCSPGGPCVVPVWPGILAPSGVLVVGLAFVLRDWVHEEGGELAVFAVILAGGALSVLVAPAALAGASLVAFMASELLDFAVYAPLRRRGLVLAVAASSVLGLVVDSVIFLAIAFGSFTYLPGQVVGKLWAVALGVTIVSLWSVWRARQAT